MEVLSEALQMQLNPYNNLNRVHIYTYSLWYIHKRAAGTKFTSIYKQARLKPKNRQYIQCMCNCKEYYHKTISIKAH